MMMDKYKIVTPNRERDSESAFDRELRAMVIRICTFKKAERLATKKEMDDG